MKLMWECDECSTIYTCSRCRRHPLAIMRPVPVPLAMARGKAPASLDRGLRGRDNW